MPVYEMVREIQNSCPNNQMRDISFLEVETDDPEAYVAAHYRATELSSERRADGSIVVWANCNGLRQRFSFTPD